ncbi:tubulin epsilon and delta complex protein 1 [Calypte anna]|uniref:tubulin epsilon and delta complex protein 1 n=1 Tax=Calypte anna TaxID=9244 RepID=UPI0011C3EAAE|nr:tubulin epsilon and delta complex protein 1 [Calypte anna]
MRRRQPQGQQERGRVLSGAVGALCRALPSRSRPAPDTLRCARFDRPQASLDFWRLLYALLKQIHGGKWTEAETIDNQIRFVKSSLWYHGYGRAELYQLPSDGSVGSRELLLAFSWMLHRLSLLEQLLAQNRVRTGDETSVCTCEDDLPNNQKGTTEAAPECGLENRIDIRYLQWLNGRLRFQWQSLHAQHQEHCKLLHKIHLFTTGSHMDQSLGHFSVTEADLVRHPKNYKQLLQLLETETMQLEAFLEWKQLEAVYWQWMETVLDNMTEEGNLCKSQGTQVEKSSLLKVTLCCPWADSLTGQIERLSSDLLTLQHQLQELVTHRKAAWAEKVQRREELQKELLPDTARKIQERVELKLLDLCAPKNHQMHGSCRLVLRSRHPASIRCVPKEAVSGVSAAEVSRELQVKQGRLKRELEKLQEECRQRLEEIAEGLDGVICISP